MSKKSFIFLGSLCVVLLAGFFAPAFAETVVDNKNWAELMAKIMLGLGLSLGLAGSAIGLSYGFQALLGGGEENFYKNIAVALLPSTQGIYAMVVLFANMGNIATAPFTVAGAGAIIGLACFFSGWYQGIVCAAGIRSIQEGKNTIANALVAGAMPETYAVFALVTTFIMK